MFTPSFDFEFNQIAATKQRIGNKVPVLQIFEYADSLVLKSGSEPFCQFTHTANPFAGINRVGDAIDPPVGGAEVGVGAEDGIIKKAGASVVGSEAPVCDERLDKFPMYSATGVIHELLDFKLIA